MLSWLLFLLLSTFSASILKMKPKCSSNTSSFLVGSLNTRIEAISAVRESQPHGFLMRSHVTQQLPIYNPNRTPLSELRNELVESLENYEDVTSILDEMYDYYPTIDHVNELYNDEKNGGTKTLLHFAVASSNTELINTLCIKYDLDIMIEDSFKYNVLESADNLGLLDMALYLIKKINGCALIPFRGYETFIHYAAISDREDILRVIKRSGFYNFEEPIPDARTSPLEFALFRESFKAADYLIKYRAFISQNALLFCYSVALDKLKFDPNPAIFILSRFPIIFYWKNQSGLDIMLLAVKNDLLSVVEYLFKSGYDISSVDYNLYVEAAYLTDSFEILDLILAEFSLKLGINKK